MYDDWGQYLSWEPIIYLQIDKTNADLLLLEALYFSKKKSVFLMLSHSRKIAWTATALRMWDECADICVCGCISEKHSRKCEDNMAEKSLSRQACLDFG